MICLGRGGAIPAGRRRGRLKMITGPPAPSSRREIWRGVTEPARRSAETRTHRRHLAFFGETCSLIAKGGAFWCENRRVIVISARFWAKIGESSPRARDLGHERAFPVERARSRAPPLLFARGSPVFGRNLASCRETRRLEGTSSRFGWRGRVSGGDLAFPRGAASFRRRTSPSRFGASAPAIDGRSTARTSAGARRETEENDGRRSLPSFAGERRPTARALHARAGRPRGVDRPGARRVEPSGGRGRRAEALPPRPPRCR